MMADITPPITKSKGLTPTESLLAALCEKTFLKFWTYPNPHKDDHDELCDLIAIFDNHVFLFFDRESRRFDKPAKSFKIAWDRWKRSVVSNQIAAAKRAEKYIKTGRPIFLDSKAEVPLPIALPQKPKIHKIIVAHGAKEACAAYSNENVYGSLALAYSDAKSPSDWPFFIDLSATDKVHMLDSHNLEILFNEFDTAWDLSNYFDAKEAAIDKYDILTYCGEEDLIAHYILNFDEKKKAHFIGTNDNNTNGLVIGEGEWESFIQKPLYTHRNEANMVSYLWDEIIQRTSQNALDGTDGTRNVRKGKSAIQEMAKEPRFIRRALCEAMFKAIESFPDPGSYELVRNLSFVPSFYKDTAYVFLQLHVTNPGDFESEYQPRRQKILEIACGAVKNKFSNLKKIIGIAIAAPKYNENLGEGLLLLECKEWPEEQHSYYEEMNKDWGFFESNKQSWREKHISEFPETPNSTQQNRKIGRNEPCHCGSGKKYKKCCRP